MDLYLAANRTSKQTKPGGKLGFCLISEEKGLGWCVVSPQRE